MNIKKYFWPPPKGFIPVLGFAFVLYGVFSFLLTLVCGLNHPGDPLYNGSSCVLFSGGGGLIAIIIGYWLIFYWRRHRDIL